MKTYVITVSRTFPSTHKRKGEPTNFIEKILENESINPSDEILRSPEFLNFKRRSYEPKLHTIRRNYPLWCKRFEEIEKGNACLSLRYWSGKPYKSKQVEIAKLTKEDGIGMQEILFSSLGLSKWADVIVYDNNDSREEIPIPTIAANDGLYFDNFKEWFGKYDLSQPMALIHFTKFRY